MCEPLHGSLLSSLQSGSLKNWFDPRQAGSLSPIGRSLETIGTAIEHLRLQAVQVEGLRDAMAAFIAHGTWEAACDALLTRALEETRYVWGLAAVLEEDDSLVVVSASHPKRSSNGSPAILPRIVVPAEDFPEPLRRAVAERSLIQALDPEEIAEIAALTPSESPPPIARIIVSPLVKGGAVVGLLIVGQSPSGDRRDDIQNIEKLKLLSESALLVFDSYQREQREALLESQLIQSQKMEAFGQLAGGIAHDFNNLLTVMYGHADLLSMKLEEGSPEREEANLLRECMDRAEALVRQLLVFSRKQPTEMKTVDLNGLVVGVQKMLKRLIGEDIELRTSLYNQLPTVEANPGQLEQVLMNLAVNARDAMPRGGQLIFETGMVELDEAYSQRHAGVSPGRYVVLTVSDTGEGMDEGTRLRIFEPFFTTKDAGRGTGLGLATVYGIVKGLGGHIGVYSEPGQGTTFKVYIPPSEGCQAVEDSPASSAEPVPANLGGTETILLVEDDPPVQDLACRALVDRGYTVIVAGSGNEALRIGRTYKGEIHLLVSDIVLPGISGQELWAQLRKAQPEMNVLYMSGYTAGSIQRQGLLLEGAPCLQKPFTLIDLQRTIRRILDQPAQLDEGEDRT